MTNILEKICAEKHALVAAKKENTPMSIVHRQALDAQPCRGFAQRLITDYENSGVGFICEIKRASPSEGVIRDPFSPEDLAVSYEDAGASCLSVLTDTPYFRGRDQDLIDALNACNLPVLRKDFMIDPWQIAQSRALGADCILLIMAVLDDQTAMLLFDTAKEYGMDVLIESHDEKELDRALKIPARLIGINSRDLKTMQTDLDNAATLIGKIPADRFSICESGIHDSNDITMMQKAGAKSFLVGTSLLRHADVGQALRSLRPRSA